MGRNRVFLESVVADEVLDSRGNPTLRASVYLSDGSSGDFIVPSGASKGKKEAVELRDNDKNYFFGKGVLRACDNINSKLSKLLIGVSPFDQLRIDNIIREYDNTHNYSNLGANAAIGLSVATAKAASASLNIELYRYIGGLNSFTMPVPLLNVINGGSHASNSLDFQEYMILPFNFDSFKDALRASCEIFYILKDMILSSNQSVSLGDEGGFAPSFKNNEEPIEFIMEAISRSRHKSKIAIALDVASGEFYDGSCYKLKSENRALTSKELIEYYKRLCAKYPIYSIEDGLSEDDLDGWKLMTKELSKKVQLVGDDIFVTNPKIFKKAISHNIANSILIKLNQVGTISQTIDAINIAKLNGYKYIISHRSGESEDSFIADFAVGMGATQIKTGSVARGERTSKYNRLLKIESSITNSRYFGHCFLK